MNEEVTKPKDRKDLDLPDASWNILEDIVLILKPLADATEALTREDSPTLSQVYVLLHSLVTVALKEQEGGRISDAERMK